MKIHVYAPGFLTHDQINSDGTVSLPDDSTLEDLFLQLCIPDSFRLSIICSVNEEKAAWETKLHEGDAVSFMYPMPGG